ncbi:MAG: ParB N-terminal domain-containing protein [Pseudomonadota bacterium]
MPPIFRVKRAEDLERIPFQDGVAAIEMPAKLIKCVELKNDYRGDSRRLEALKATIRRDGFQPFEPIVARIGRKGRWVIIDGGHRLTAAREIMDEFWTNLFGTKVKIFYFVLFTTEDSWAKVDPPLEMVPQPVDPRLRHAMQVAWDDAKQRARSLESGLPLSGE